MKLNSKSNNKAKHTSFFGLLVLHLAKPSYSIWHMVCLWANNFLFGMFFNLNELSKSAVFCLIIVVFLSPLLQYFLNKLFTDWWVFLLFFEIGGFFLEQIWLVDPFLFDLVEDFKADLQPHYIKSKHYFKQTDLWVIAFKVPDFLSSFFLRFLINFWWERLWV